MRRLFLLIVGSLAFWVLVALPARALAANPSDAERIITYCGTGLLLCLVPMGITLLWGNRILEQPPEQQVILILGGTGVRMFVILIAGWIVFRTIPYFHQTNFLLWLAGTYMFTLLLEVTLLLLGRTDGKSEEARQT